MSEVIYVPDGQASLDSQIGATLESLERTIEKRKDAGQESYTYRLMNAKGDDAIKKLLEEAGEVALAAKDADQVQSGLKAHKNNPHVPSSRVKNMELRLGEATDHLRYESADLIYHLLVVLRRYGISLDEVAAELNSRMTDDERPQGGALIAEGRVNRGK